MHAYFLAWRLVGRRVLLVVAAAMLNWATSERQTIHHGKGPVHDNDNDDDNVYQDRSTWPEAAASTSCIGSAARQIF